MKAFHITVAMWLLTGSQYAGAIPTTELLDVLQNNGLQDLNARELSTLLHSLALGPRNDVAARQEAAPAEGQAAEDAQSDASEDSEASEDGGASEASQDSAASGASQDSGASESSQDSKGSKGEGKGNEVGQSTKEGGTATNEEGEVQYTRVGALLYSNLPSPP